jgi:LysR family nitrogen assimilation transcriptional regulator
LTLSTRHLECFLSIAESGSFSNAAIRLGWSQPVLSRYAKELEEELKVKLLYRDGRGVVLTAAGQRFRGRATELLKSFAEARLDALGTPQQMLESAAVGMPPTVTRILALPLARAIYAAYPETRLRLIESFSGHLLEWLSDDRMDAAILYGSEATQRLNAEPLLVERLHLIAPAQQGPLPAEISLSEVARLPLILPSRPHGLRRPRAHRTARGGRDRLHRPADSQHPAGAGRGPVDRRPHRRSTRGALAGRRHGDEAIEPHRDRGADPHYQDADHGTRCRNGLVGAPRPALRPRQP